MAVTLVVRGAAARALDGETRQAVARRVRAALAALHRSRSSVALVLTDDGELRALNSRFRRIDRATDVLSFQQQELAGESDPRGNHVELGDIVISVEAARRQAQRHRGRSGVAFRRELEHLAVHGLCHLFGHDHQRPAQARRMRALERRLFREC